MGMSRLLAGMNRARLAIISRSHAAGGPAGRTLWTTRHEGAYSWPRGRRPAGAGGRGVRGCTPDRRRPRLEGWQGRIRCRVTTRRDAMRVGTLPLLIAAALLLGAAGPAPARSEERRVGKERERARLAYPTRRRAV